MVCTESKSGLYRQTFEHRTAVGQYISKIQVPTISPELQEISASTILVYFHIRFHFGAVCPEAGHLRHRVF